MSDLKPSQCQEVQNVVETILPQLGQPVSRRSQILMRRMFGTSQPLTFDETDLLYRELQRGAHFLKQLTSFPTHWDRDKTENLLKKTLAYFQNPLMRGKGLRANCLGLGLFARIEPSLVESSLPSEDFQKIMKHFRLNQSGRSIPDYFKGEIIAGAWRPGSKHLLIVYADNPLAEGVQRDILTAYWNLHQEGRLTLALEGISFRHDRSSEDKGLQDFLKKVPPERMAQLRKSVGNLLSAFDQEARRIRSAIEQQLPRDLSMLFYSTQARNLLLGALNSGGNPLIGLNDPALSQDANLLCRSNIYENQKRHPLEERVLYEACVRYPLELHTHLSLRRLKRSLGTEERLIFVATGVDRVVSVASELKDRDYHETSFLIIAPQSLFRTYSQEKEWLERQIQRLQRQFRSSSSR